MDDNTAHDDADQELADAETDTEDSSNSATREKPVAAPGIIDPELVEPAAVEVVQGLRDRDFEAYLVGGCVRDLLLGLTPKDFDVATNATPEEVRQVFRRSRTVGRRFRIVHVRVGRQLFEVSTYRKNVDEDDFPEDVTTSEDGVILRDNSYGTMEDDTFRRDFTVNAMYYDPLDGSVTDLAGGRDDLKECRLRLIGEPQLRLREDPVRILRAIRFAAKLDFDIDHSVQDAIPPTAELLTAIPPARLFDEMNKLFLGGKAARAWELMRKFGLAEILFPATNPEDELVTLAMESTDGRIADDKPVTPGFLFAVLLWDDYQARITENALQQSMQEAENNAAAECIREQQLTIAIPRRFAQFIRDVWALQPKLERRQPKNLARMLSHPKFRAGYDFLLLRAEMNLVEQEAADYWTEIQKTHDVVPRPDPDDEDDDGNRRDGRGGEGRSRRRRGGRKRSGGSAGSGNSDNSGNSGNKSGGNSNRGGRNRGGRKRSGSSNPGNNSSGNSSGGDVNGNVAVGSSAGNTAASKSNSQKASGEDGAPKKKRRRRRRPRRRNSGEGGGEGGNSSGNSSGNSGGQSGGNSAE